MKKFVFDGIEIFVQETTPTTPLLLLETSLMDKYPNPYNKAFCTVFPLGKLKDSMTLTLKKVLYEKKPYQCICSKTFSYCSGDLKEIVPHFCDCLCRIISFKNVIYFLLGKIQKKNSNISSNYYANDGIIATDTDVMKNKVHATILLKSIEMKEEFCNGYFINENVSSKLNDVLDIYVFNDLIKYNVTPIISSEERKTLCLSLLGEKFQNFKSSEKENFQKELKSLTEEFEKLLNLESKTKAIVWKTYNSFEFGYFKKLSERFFNDKRINLEVLLNIKEKKIVPKDFQQLLKRILCNYPFKFEEEKEDWTSSVFRTFISLLIGYFEFPLKVIPEYKNLELFGEKKQGRIDFGLLGDSDETVENQIRVGFEMKSNKCFGKYTNMSGNQEFAQAEMYAISFFEMVVETPIFVFITDILTFRVMYIGKIEGKIKFGYLKNSENEEYFEFLKYNGKSIDIGKDFEVILSLILTICDWYVDNYVVKESYWKNKFKKLEKTSKKNIEVLENILQDIKENR